MCLVQLLVQALVARRQQKSFEGCLARHSSEFLLQQESTVLCLLVLPMVELESVSSKQEPQRLKHSRYWYVLKLGQVVEKQWYQVLL